MKARIFKYVAATALLLLAACAKEPIGPEPQPGHTIHYSATVSEGTSTRATVDADYHYIFETGDKLYVTDAAGKSYGVLTLSSGAGTTTATFQGELICDNEYQPVDDTELSAVLVSTKDAIHTITNDKVEADRKPITAFATDFADAVSKYGDFTATSTFGAHSFTLNQQNSFLIFNVEVASSATVSTTVNTGSGSLTANVTPVTLGTQHVARFVAAYPGGTALSGASATVGTKNLPLHNATLTANCYYLINEPLSPFTGFTIRAIEDNTTITLNGKYRGPDATYKGNNSSDPKNLITTAGKVQYSLTNGLFWEDFTSSDGVVVVLQAGQTLCLRGTKRVYNAYNTTGTPNNPDTYEPFFTATKLCYVGGELMSLMSTDENYTAHYTEMLSGGFNGFFAGSWWIDNDPEMPLTISATAFVYNELTGEDKNHYKNMFRNCTNLKTAPALPVTTLKVGCYMDMFYGCSSLTTAPDLPAPILKENCYYEMFRGCTQLNYIKCLATSGFGSKDCTKNWVNGVSESEESIFVKYHKDTDWGSPGVNKIPLHWKVQWVNE